MVLQNLNLTRQNETLMYIEFIEIMCIILQLAFW